MDSILAFHDNFGVRLILLILAILYFICALAPFMKKYEDTIFVKSFKNAVFIIAIIDVALIILREL